MDAQFWIKAWNEGGRNFHKEKYHEKLVQYFPQLSPQKDQKVLVPLCGKTKDLLWLHERGLRVHGVELYEKAVKEFFLDNQLPSPQIARDQDFIRYTYKNIVIRCGDFFKLGEKNAYDFVYDRAALVALPAPMRKSYAEVITQCLKKGGKYLLISYEYDQSKMEGPPFSVNENEIRELYGDRFTVRLMESETPVDDGPRLASLESIKQKVYILEKI